MRQALQRLALFFLLVLLVAPCYAGETFRLTILHTNDLHGMMEPHLYSNDDSPFQGPERELGGLARLATAIRQSRARSDNVVVVDTGDVFTRGPWHRRWYGEPEIEAMNLIGYDMLVVGNNELKPIWGDPVSEEMMLSLMRRSRFPWLAANLTLGSGPPPGCDSRAFVEGIHPFVVRSFGPVRVGFLGLTTAVTPDYAFLRGWTVGDPIATAKQWVAIARRYCDVLIAVTHIGTGTGSELARQVDGIDAIVGGHSHTFLSEPLIVKGPSGRDVPMAQAGELGVVLGVFELEFEKDPEWRLKQATARLVPIDASYAEDPAVRGLLDRYVKQPAPQEGARLPVLFTAGP
jgi:2',3'-cyclic-nucleotide 2'-phosphodiesterase (5'-nucleotidase family)